MPRPVISGTAGLESVGDAQTEKMQTRSYIICRVWVMMLSSSGGRPGVASMNEYASMVCPAAGSVVFFLVRPGGNVKFPWARFFIHAAGWLVLITHDDGCTWPTAYSINYMVCKLHPSWDKVHERYFCESIIKWWPETARAQTNWSSYVKQLESPRESTRLARCWPPGFRRYLGNCYHRFQLIEYPNYQTWSQAYNSIRDEQQT